MSSDTNPPILAELAAAEAREREALAAKWAKYRATLERSGGKAKPKAADAAELRGLMADLGLTMKDVAAHLEAIDRHRDLGRRIEAGNRGQRDVEEGEREAKALNEEIARAMEPFNARGALIAAKVRSGMDAMDAGGWSETRLADLEAEHWRLFGKPEPARPERAKEKSPAEYEREQHENVERSQAQSMAAALRDGYARPEEFDAAACSLVVAAKDRGWVSLPAEQYDAIARRGAKLLAASTRDKAREARLPRDERALLDKARDGGWLENGLQPPAK